MSEPAKRFQCVEGPSGKVLGTRGTKTAAMNFFDRNAFYRYPRNLPNPRVIDTKTGDAWERRGVSWFGVSRRAAPIADAAPPARPPWWNRED